MSEKIEINGFVGIRNADLELNKFNVLIGPQASGKSVIAKLLYYFKSFPSHLFNCVQDGLTKRQIDAKLLNKFDEYFPAHSWGDGKFQITYRTNELFITIERAEIKKQKLNLRYSDNYKSLIGYARRKIVNEKKKISKKAHYKTNNAIMTARQSYFKKFADDFGIASAYDQIFIPAGRSFFANLQSSIFSFLSSNAPIDPFMKEFGKLYETIKNLSEGRFLYKSKRDLNMEIDQNIEMLIEKILHAKYIIEKGKQYLFTKGGRKIAILNSSSGQQEILPLLIFLSFLPMVSFGINGATIYIEEPEAHLFPIAQKHVVELMACVFDKNHPTQFMITTHSPYILTALNNLLFAGGLVKKRKDEIVEKVVPKICVINPSYFSAYSINTGKCDNIIHKDSGLIDTNIIDEVSNILSSDFDYLLDNG